MPFSEFGKLFSFMDVISVSFSLMVPALTLSMEESTFKRVVFPDPDVHNADEFPL